MKKRKFIRKFTVFNVLANIALILFLLLNVANVVIKEFGSKLGSIGETVGKYLPNVQTWASDYITAEWGGANGILPKLILIGIGVGTLLVFILTMCFAKHNKGWNLISWTLILADAAWFVYLVTQSDIKLFGDDFISTIKSLPEKNILTNPTDINLFAHVILFLFLTFAVIKGTKRIYLVEVETPSGQIIVEKVPEKKIEEKPTYRTITLSRKVAPFCRAQRFDCWFNGEMLSTIGDGQEKTFLVDRYGAELVVVSPYGVESNIINIPEGEDDKKFVITTSRDTSGVLSISIA